MIKKPWPIIILAFLHIFEPVIKTLILASSYGLEPLINSVQQLWNNHAWVGLFEYFLLYPIAGYAIFRVKNWSIPVFVSCIIWMMISNIDQYVHHLVNHQFLELVAWIFFLGLNLLIVSYFLTPAVKIAYTNPRMRWWEVQHRYQVELKCLIDGHDQAQILNISQSGVFITSAQPLATDREYTLNFESHNIKMHVLGVVAHQYSQQRKSGYGIRFIHMTDQNKKSLKKLINILESEKYPRRPERISNFSDFKKWFKEFYATGKGIYPENDYPSKE